MRAALLFAPKFKGKKGVMRILELRGWSIVSSRPDYVITVGGDGSILYAEMKYPGKPIIAFNFGELGFLAPNKEKDMEKALISVEKGRYSVDEREKLEFSVGKQKGEALNDVLVASSVIGKALRLNVAVGSHKLGQFVCDGVLVATPTGSTGYNASCGGPVVEPGAAVITLTLINPHLSKLKSIVLSGDETVSISFARQNPGITVVADGLKSVRASHKAVIAIRKSKEKARLVRLTDSYFAKLRGAFT